MAVQTNFFDWGYSGLDWDRDPYEDLSPNLRAVGKYIEKRWGGYFYGWTDVDRTIRGGQKVSTHAYGAALDIRYESHPSVSAEKWPGRQTVENEIIPWLIANSAELGIQAILDDRRSWRPPAWRDRRGQAHVDGWVRRKGRYYGWIHIETTFDDFADDRSVEERLGLTAPEPPAEPVEPHRWQRFVDENPKPVLRVGSRGEHVRFIQEVMRAWGQDVAVDGHFGPQTHRGVTDVQRAWGVAVDGIVGNRQTWPIYSLLAHLKIQEG